MTHNQGVPGSSPGGPTGIKQLEELILAAFSFTCSWSLCTSLRFHQL